MKNKRRILCFLILFLLASSISYSEKEGNVYIIPIKSEINKATYHFLQNAINDALSKNPKAIIFEIDTYGGLINEAEKIKNLIMDIKVPTISFVNNKAESAGVLLTISSEKVVMAESSTIGSAETIPNDEKTMSLWLSFLRDVAEIRGRNPEIIQAMADRDIEIDGVVEGGKLLNLNSREAKEHGICDLVSNNYDEILDYFHIEYSDIVNVEEGVEVKIAKYLSNPYLSTFLLTLGFIGLVIEIFTPGFGIGGTLSIVGFALFFGGNILAGNSGWTALILFIAGLILLIIEGMIPGFGLPGISGIILVSAGVILSMNAFSTAIISLSIALIVAFSLIIILMKYGYKSPVLNKIVLSTEQKNEKGYTSANPRKEYLNKEGVSITELRPSGVVEIESQRIDALSEGEYIERNKKVKVVRVEGSKIFVRRV